MASTAFERSGGFATLSKVVSAFYDKLLESPDLSRFFEGVDMRSLIDHQTKYIAAVMGGPASYSDEALGRVHARLNISAEEFREMAYLLRETLEDFEIADDDIDFVEQEVLKREDFIVTKH